MISRLLQSLTGLLYPNLCAVCGTPLVVGEEVLCTGCNYHIPKTRNWHEPNNPIAKVFWGRVYLQHACAFVYFRKGSRYQKLLHKLKYAGRKDIGRYLGRQFGQELVSVRPFNDLFAIIPVPLHPKKQKKRGYNQSEWISLGLSDSLHLPVITNLLKRAVYTETQTHKGRMERWENVSDVFDIDLQPNIPEGSHLLLVDDVVTTGATLEACARQLIEKGNFRVSIATIAFASQ
jgi:Predicted amidophosphoribosyltransferases